MADMEIRPPAGSRKQKRIAGRGKSARRGGKAGRGDKGQNSRSGGGVRPGFEGGQMPLYRRIPRKGFSNSRFRREYAVVNVDILEKKFADGETVSMESLVQKKIIKKKTKLVKILAEGELSKRLAVEIDAVSNQAKEKIEKAGGTVKGSGVAVAGQPEAAQASAEKSGEQNRESEKEGSVDGE